MNRLAQFPAVSRNLAAGTESSEITEGWLSSVLSGGVKLSSWSIATAIVLSALAVVLYRRRTLGDVAEKEVDEHVPEIECDAEALV